MIPLTRSGAMSVQNLCRTCLTPSKNMHLIFDGTQQGDATNVVVEVLQTFVKCSITPTDNASQYICSDCLKKMYDTYAFMLQCRQSDTAFRQLTESQVSLKRLKDPIEFVEYVIEDKGVDINMTNDVNGLENANEDGVVYNGHYSNAEPQSFDLTADSDKEIQSGEEEVGDEILECPACLDAFGMISVLRTHLIEVHTMDSMCIMCNNECFDDIWKHTRVHVPRKHACNECGKKFIRDDTLQKHIEMHLDKREKLTCEVCHLLLATEDELEDHFAKIHKYCRVCSKTFASRKSLNRHKKIHLRLRDYVCKVCGRKYKKKESYDTHVLIHQDTDENMYLRLTDLTEDQHTGFVGHGMYYNNENNDSDMKYDGEEDGQMPIGEESSNEMDAMEYWQDEQDEMSATQFAGETITNTKPLPLRCDVCSKAFRDKQCLNDHKTVHTGERPFECQLCGKKFRVKRNLRQHVISHSRATPYVCGFCGVRFKKRHIIIGHIMQKHSEAQSFPCGLCPEVLADTTELTRHWRYSHILTYTDVNISVG